MTAHGQNLLQKGFYHQAGGQWKLQLDAGGFPRCVVFGSFGRVIVHTEARVANGRWHRVSCTRAGNRVTVRVDGRVKASEQGATGRIASDADVRIGGKKIKAGNKQFHGDLDSVGMRFIR